jgi:hypothetical protein
MPEFTRSGDREASASKYLLIFAATVLMLLGAMLAVNVAVDPLWYFRGNRLTHRNLALDERLSKAILLDRMSKKPNCVLFGTSVATLMNDADGVAEDNCFNFAVSAGRPSEFQAFAEWMAKRGTTPRTVILAVDASMLIPSNEPDSLPDFIRKGEGVPTPIASYVSFGALRFSADTLFDPDKRPRYYDGHFNSKVIATKPYDPRVRHKYLDFIGSFRQEPVLEAISAFRSTWPGVRVYCYVPPFTPGYVSALEQAGMLAQYTRTMWEIAQRCDSFRDFAIPSDLSDNPNLTYDGVHYIPKANARAAAAFHGNGDLPQSNINGMSPGQYLRAYESALQRFPALPSLSAPGTKRAVS